MKETLAVQVLRQVKDVLDGEGTQFWLESGALLGAVRSGKFISWDIDIDLGTLARNDLELHMKTLAKEFCKKGFETYFSLYHNIMAMEKNGIDVQLNFWRLVDDEATTPLQYKENLLGAFLFNAVWILLFSHSGEVNSEALNTTFKKVKFVLVKITSLICESFKLRLAKFFRGVAKKTGNRRGLAVIPRHFFTKFSNIEFYGMKFKTPAPVEDYLLYYYGEDWRIPTRDWTYVRKDRKIISRTERIGRDWKYLKL